jgi:hypothetical protein
MTIKDKNGEKEYRNGKHASQVQRHPCGVAEKGLVVNTMIAA